MSTLSAERLGAIRAAIVEAMPHDFVYTPKPGYVVTKKDITDILSLAMEWSRHAVDRVASPIRASTVAEAMGGTPLPKARDADDKAVLEAFMTVRNAVNDSSVLRVQMAKVCNEGMADRSRYRVDLIVRDGILEWLKRVAEG